MYAVKVAKSKPDVLGCLFIVDIAFPEIAADFSGSTLGELSWILNAYAIVFAALIVPAGRLADVLPELRPAVHVGRRRRRVPGLDPPRDGHRTLPPERLATGTGVFGTSRQLGSAIGVAVLIALIANPIGPAELSDGLKRGWTAIVLIEVFTAAICLSVGPVGVAAATRSPAAPAPSSA